MSCPHHRRPAPESNCDIYLKPGPRSRDTPPPILPTFPIGTILASSVKSLNSRYQSRMQKYMENDEKKPVWEKNSRGFWLTVCLMLGAVAGWLMFHLGVLH